MVVNISISVNYKQSSIVKFIRADFSPDRTVYAASAVRIVLNLRNPTAWYSSSSSSSMPIQRRPVSSAEIQVEQLYAKGAGTMATGRVNRVPEMAAITPPAAAMEAPAVKSGNADDACDC